MLRDMAELQGQSIPSDQNIADLELQVSSIIIKGKRIKGLLLKENVYHDLEDLAVRFGLDFESYNNADVVTQKFLDHQISPSDRFSRDDCELFLQLIDLAAIKAKAKRQLDILRRARINGESGHSTEATDSNPSNDSKPDPTQSVLPSEENSESSAEDCENEETDLSEEEESEENSSEY